jgi:HAD superfamily hydrolase (TIGR01509 family)
VVRLMDEEYRRELPVLPGASGAVERLAARWPLGLASSSNREVIDLVLERAGWARRFAATVSSEEVARGKPAPDVYVEAARRLRAPAERCVGVEDSSAGIRSARAAGLAVIAVPNREYRPDEQVLGEARVVLGSLVELDTETVEQVGERGGEDE